MRCWLLSLLLFTALPVPAMSELDEQALEEVSGQEGISLLLELRINADANGEPLAALAGCSGVGNPCNFSLKFNNRNSGSGEWLKLKDAWGRLYINGLKLDYLPNPGTPSAYDNPVRYQNESGTCLLALCEASGVPALGLSFAGDLATHEDDVSMKFNVGRLAIEYGATGYTADANGGFLGFRIRDDAVTGNAASIDIDGSVRLYGF